MVTEFDKLIPELAQWNNGAGIDASSWISCIGRYDFLLGYISILWPAFVLYDDCVFPGLPDPKHYQGFMQSLGGDKREVEKVMNHQHISDMFTVSEFPLTEDAALVIGRVLKEMWSCKLARDFPDRAFSVEFFAEDRQDAGASDPLLRHVITFCQTVPQRRA